MTLLTRHRLSLGLSLRDVGNSLTPAFSTSQIAAAEKGGINHRSDIVQRLAVFYGLSPAEIRRLANARI